MSADVLFVHADGSREMHDVSEGEPLHWQLLDVPWQALTADPRALCAVTTFVRKDLYWPANVMGPLESRCRELPLLFGDVDHHVVAIYVENDPATIKRFEDRFAPY